MTCPQFSNNGEGYFCSLKGYFNPSKTKLEECYTNYTKCLEKAIEEERLKIREEAERISLEHELGTNRRIENATSKQVFDIPRVIGGDSLL